VNVEPWHGHTNCEPENPVMAQPSCVQVAVNTVAALADVRVTRNVPMEVCAMPMPPADASGVPVVVMVTVRPLTAADTDVNG
jgi:hypothetical protein